MSIRTLSLTDDIAPAWDRLVYGSPDGWLFSLSSWQKLILGVPEWGLEDHSFAVYDDMRLAAVVPLQWSKITNRMTSTGWSGSGPVIGPDYHGPARDRMLNFALRRAMKVAAKAGASVFDFWTSPVTQTSVQNGWDRSPVSASAHEFRDLSQLSQVIDLGASEERLHADLDADARRLIRRAAEARVEVRLIDWHEFVDAYYAVHCETYTRTGVSPHPYAYFAGIARYMAPLGHSVLFAAFQNGKPIAFVNIGRFNTGAVYHTGCSVGAALKNGANYALLWQAILWCRQNGCQFFDVGAVFPGEGSEKQKGLTMFKTKFGGSLRRFFRCEFPVTPTPSLGARILAAIRAARLHSDQLG